jgi:hypothetical protein
MSPVILPPVVITSSPPLPGRTSPEVLEMARRFAREDAEDIRRLNRDLRWFGYGLAAALVLEVATIIALCLSVQFAQ